MFISIILTGFSSQLVSVHLPLSEELTCTAFMNRTFITECRCRVLRVIAVFRVLVRVYRDDNNSCRCISTVEIQENTRGAALYNTLDIINISNISTI